jgi:tetratricopeptide (TPR) repeat protein
VRGLARSLWPLVALALAGCASAGPRLTAYAGGAALPPRVELDATPFFPQRDYQCGPAALATVLSASGVATNADELVDSVYLPGRKGSLQPEIVAATRSRGRLPYVVPPNVEALLTSLAGGEPVLVLQKLGAGPWPGWHYAVLIGYDLEANEFLLRSGTDRRLAMSAKKFLWSWDRAGRWSVLALAPGELPPSADAASYLEGAAGLEAVGRNDEAAVAYRAAIQAWPESPVPHLGLGNLAHAGGDYVTAAGEYREAIERDAADPVAAHNLAETLLVLGCPEKARAQIETARRLAGTGPFASAVASTADDIARETARDRAECVAW